MEGERRTQAPGLLEPVREDVVPGVPAKQHRLARLDHLYLSVFRIRQDQCAADDDVGDIGAEHGAVGIRVEAFSSGGRANTSIWRWSVDA